MSEHQAGKVAAIAVRRVSKVYEGGLEALREVSLEFAAGRVTALVGRSGCGKTTLLNLCGAMDFPTAGEVIVAGHVTSGLGEAELTALRREKIGFVFQFFQLLPALSVLENVELPLLLAGARGSEKTAMERLAWVGLEDRAAALPYQLSGGQMQRVGIARALIHSPSILLADEPTGNLDSATGNVILDLLRRLTAEHNTATIMATHSLEAAALADAVVQMRDGKIQEVVYR